MKAIILSFFLIASLSVLSQDLIIKTNSDTIHCHIVNVSPKEIRYFPNMVDSTDAPFRIATKVVRKIIYADGSEKAFVKGISKNHYEEIQNAEYYDNLHKNALKIHALSLIAGSITFTYERSIKPGMSFELGAGYIYGIRDTSISSNERGYILRGGLKLIRHPSFYKKREVYAHLLKGAYLKAEIIFNSFQRENTNLSTPSLKVWEYISSTSIVLNMGKQVVYNDFFLIDWYGFLGYGKASYQNGYFYSNIIIAQELPISFGLGIRVGFVFL